jgi:hypothetical protein
MITRQQFIHAGAALVAAPLSLQGCNSADTPSSYEAAVKQIWQPIAGKFDNRQALQRELVRYATLAPSGHNTQCWKFHIEPDAISILPDFTRRTPVVDPDDHHLFVSLGCALENMAQASLAYGLQTLAQFDSAKDVVTVKLASTTPLTSPLFKAITDRQCTRGLYDGQALTASELKTLELAGTGKGVRMILFTAKPDIEKILDFVMQGNTMQLSDMAFVNELKQWLRFGAGEAVRTGDGLYSLTSGNLSVPRWLGSPLFDAMFSAKSENDKYAKQTRSSAGIAVFVSDVDDKTHWIEAGRCYERFALQATSMGIRNAMLNQTVEVPPARRELARFLGLQGGRPDLVVRFGRGKQMPQSLRRGLQDVLI